MEVGRFNRRIKIQKKGISDDRIGNQSEKWEDFHSCWAEIKCVSAREYNSARQENAENTVTFKVRYCEKIKNVNSTDYRIIFRGVNYDVQAVDNSDFSNRFITLRAISEYDRSGESE